VGTDDLEVTFGVELGALLRSKPTAQEAKRASVRAVIREDIFIELA
jgi:hypothetical protein